MDAMAPSPVPGTLPGPMVKENRAAVDCNAQGLIAYACGSSIAIVEVQSMQLVHTLAGDRQGDISITAVRWSPEGVSRDLSQSSYTRLASGDQRGRIAIWDAAGGEVMVWCISEGGGSSRGEGSGMSRSSDGGPKITGPVQDLCWVIGKPWMLAAIHGASVVALWDANSGRAMWRIDWGPDAALACLRCDPFDPRQLVIAGVRGFLLTMSLTGVRETDFTKVEHRIPVVPLEEKASTEKDKPGKEERALATLLAGAPAVRCLFSDCQRGILYVMLPREILTFDLQFGMQIASTSLSRNFAKFLDILAIVDGRVLYCLHADGKLSAWQRHEQKQVFTLRQVETLLPAIGSSLPAPQMLAAVHSPRHTISNCHTPGPLPTFAGTGSSSSPFSAILSADNGLGDGHLAIRATLVALTDDGRLWQWQAKANISPSANSLARGSERPPQLLSSTSWGPSSSSAKSGHSRNAPNHASWGGGSLPGPEDSPVPSPTDVSGSDISTPGGPLSGSGRSIPPGSPRPSMLPGSENTPMEVKMELTGMMHTLSSQVTTLATPSAPMPAAPGVAMGATAMSPVPLVALALHGGSIELMDAATTSVTATFSIHNSPVRAVRWLGSSKLVSFSYTEARQVKGKHGGFVNKIVVTCIRSGQSRQFRQTKGPEKASMRGLRTSPSGRYLLILFRDAPAEVWAMTREPQLLRSLALPFTVMEWAIPVPPGSSFRVVRRPSSSAPEKPSAAATAVAPASTGEVESVRSADAHEEPGESFAFALVNGSLGVFELRGRRVRDFRPRWPVASFVNDVLVTAMAFRMPIVTMGDRAGNMRWWDITSGVTGGFATHRGGIRRLRFVPQSPQQYDLIGPGRGRVAVLFNDRSFDIYDLETQDAVPNVFLQANQTSLLAIEIDFLTMRPPPPPLHLPENPLLAVAAIDGSLRLLAVQLGPNRAVTRGSIPTLPPKSPAWQKFRPLTLSTPAAMLPPAQTQALRLLLQLGVNPSWLDVSDSWTDLEDLVGDGAAQPRSRVRGCDLRLFLLETPGIPALGDKSAPEVLIKGLEPHCQAGRLLDVDATFAYAAICKESVAARCAFAAAHFGDVAEALFWTTLPRALSLLSKGFAGPGTFWADVPGGFRRRMSFAYRQSKRFSSMPSSSSFADRRPPKPSPLATISSAREEDSAPPPSPPPPSKSADATKEAQQDRAADQPTLDNEGVSNSDHEAFPFRSQSQRRRASFGPGAPCEGGTLLAGAKDRIAWHDRLVGHDATQKRIHELITVGDYEAAVTLLLSTPPDSPTFFVDAMRAITLSSAVSPAMHELAIKVVAANLVVVDDVLSGTHILCAIGRYQEACAQLQDSGKWGDAATLAAAHLEGIDRARVFERWGDHVLRAENNLWWGVSLLVAAGALGTALSALRAAKLPDAAAFFLLACHELKARIVAERAAESGEAKAIPDENTGLPKVMEEGKGGAEAGVGEGSSIEEGRNGDVEAKGDEEKVALKNVRVVRREVSSKSFRSEGQGEEEDVDPTSGGFVYLDLPGDLQEDTDEVKGVCEYFAQYERWLAHLCNGDGTM